MNDWINECQFPCPECVNKFTWKETVLLVLSGLIGVDFKVDAAFCSDVTALFVHFSYTLVNQQGILVCLQKGNAGTSRASHLCKPSIPCTNPVLSSVQAIYILDKASCASHLCKPSVPAIKRAVQAICASNPSLL
eukprot:scaffold223139_cov21-Tisochrysis_lutea.AAC.1